MAVIVASLFLPYTVQFEVNAERTETKDAPKPIRPPNSRAPSYLGEKTSASIIPSLAAANSLPATGVNSPENEHGPDSKTSTNEEFFYNYQNSKFLGTNFPVIEPVESKPAPGSAFIQPRPRYTRVQSSVSDRTTSKGQELSGLLGLKINRSSTPPIQTSVAYTSKPRTVLSGSSSVREGTAEREGSEDKNDDFNCDDGNRYLPSEPRLAPFGGFSTPSIERSILNHENIFETAPWNIVPYRKGNGSLINAVKLAADSGIIPEKIWVGTLAMASDDVPESTRSKISDALKKDYDCETVFTSDVTFQGHYKSFCKQILWPSFHYQIPDNPKSKAFEDHSWEHYKLLNQLIADKVIETYKSDDDIIWVHDYHLLLVPKMVREKLPNAKIGFFLHVSFPSSEVFRCFAQRVDILEGMLGANVISFQTDEYVRHFLQTCNRLLLADISKTGLVHKGNMTIVNTIPVGIDTESLNVLLSNEKVNEWRHLIRDRWKSQKLIVSRDKLDKIRGVKHKLLAYEKFLKNNPEFLEKTVLIQVSLSSTDDPDFQTEINVIVARINSMAPNISVHQPVVLLQSDIDFHQYLALMTEADVFCVSSTREGLNLTCHEFIVATKDKQSPLILSEFTGSGALLAKSALLINPWDIKHFSETFLKALTLSEEEKLRNWKVAYDIVDKHDSKHWVSKCLESIVESWDEMVKNQNFSSLTPEIIKAVYNEDSTGKRLFFLNFETPSVSQVISKGSALSQIDPQRLVLFLSDLLSDERNIVYIISYLRRFEVEIQYKRVPNLGLIAENGGYIKYPGCSSWISNINENTLDWMGSVIKLMKTKAESLPGGYIEIEDCTVTLHAERALIEDAERAYSVMGECITHVNDLFGGENVHATFIKDVVVVQHRDLSIKSMKNIVLYTKTGVMEETEYSKIPSSAPTTPANQPDEIFPVKPEIIHSLYVFGGSTSVDEPAYEYASELEASDEAQQVLTIAIGPTIQTYAKVNAKGLNELVSIFSRLAH